MSRVYGDVLRMEAVVRRCSGLCDAYALDPELTTIDQVVAVLVDERHERRDGPVELRGEEGRRLQGRIRSPQLSGSPGPHNHVGTGPNYALLVRMVRRRDLSPDAIQRDFYAATAVSYDDAHVHDGDEHQVALEFVSALIAGYGYRSVLDVGAGTGRAVMYLMDAFPDVVVRGVEPVDALITQAVQSNGVPAGAIVTGSGSDLPFADGEFDVVIATGVMHHVPKPSALVAEMIRVSNRGIFISDNNRFGRGSRTARWVKLFIHRTGLWPLAYRIRNRGKNFYYNEGDGGVAYSYSVYDSVAQLNEWADRVFVMPTVPAAPSVGHPLMTATHGLLCAMKDE